MAQRYQVPSKNIGEFRISEDRIYEPKLDIDSSTGEIVDVNFGALASCDTVPLATNAAAGGVKIASPEAFSQSGRTYPVQLEDIGSSSGYACVTVPWVNTWYTPNADAEISVADSSGVAAGPVEIGLRQVPARKVTGLGDIAVSSFSEVRTAIVEPFDRKIDETAATAAQQLLNHQRESSAKIDTVSSAVGVLSANVYKKNETSSAVQIADGLASGLQQLCSDVKSYLANTVPGAGRTNPAWLRSETSSATEIADALSRKQSKLGISQTISQSSPADYMPTVDAVRKFVNSSINSTVADFQGSFSSWSAVPDVSSGYQKPPPRKFDYIYVYVNAADAASLGLDGTGTWRFIMSSDSWSAAAGKKNWTAQYKIASTQFTSAQQAALDSGVTRSKLDDIESRLLSLEAAVEKLNSLLAGMSRQTWTFESFSSSGSHVQKTVLAEDS